MRKLAFLICALMVSLPALAQSEVQVIGQPGLHYEFLATDGAYLGVRLRNVDGQDVQHLKLPSETGALVEDVVDGSPAAAAGLLRDDVITAVSGLPILTASQLQRTIRENPVGRHLELSVFRGGRKLSLGVQLGEAKGSELTRPLLEFKDLEELPEGRRFQWRQGSPNLFFFRDDDRPRLGVQATPLTTQMSEFLGAGVEEGLLIMQVESGTAAEKAGLRAGDVITKIDGKSVGSVGALREALEAGSHQLEIVRNGQRQQLEVQLGEDKPKGERTRI